MKNGFTLVFSIFLLFFFMASCGNQESYEAGEYIFTHENYIHEDDQIDTIIPDKEVVDIVDIDIYDEPIVGDSEPDEQQFFDDDQLETDAETIDSETNDFEIVDIDLDETPDDDFVDEPYTCNTEAGIDTAALDSYGPGAVRAVHLPISCGSGSTVEQDNGPPKNRINLIIIGDGYTENELEITWANHISNALEIMFGPNTEPYGTYRKYINVCRLNVASPESGVDLATGNWPPSTYDYFEYKDTAFDGVCNEENRLGTMDDYKVRQKFEEILAGTGMDVDWVGGVLNTDRWCNAGGAFAYWAGYTNPLDVAFHESGHSWHGLADEYGGDRTYTGDEPQQVNITKFVGAKWQEWEGYNQLDIGLIDWYEGGFYSNKGIYRPSLDSKMNWTGNPHNAVCIQKMVHDIYALVRPIDAWTDNRQVLQNPCSIEIKLIDPALVNVTWRIDSEIVYPEDIETLILADYNLTKGTHTIEVVVEDPTDYVRDYRSDLKQTLKWNVEIGE